MARKVKHIELIDKHIGTKIQELRIAQGLSRQDLGEKIEVTHQQLQKYEMGINRVSAGRLALIAQCLATNVGTFYEGLNTNYSSNEENHQSNQNQRMCIELSKNFMRIKNPDHKDAISSLIKILARGESFKAEELLTDIK